MIPNELHERAWTRTLRAKNLSPRTIVNYLDATRALRVHVADEDLADITAKDLEGFFADQAERLSPTTAAIRYRALQQFFKWAAREEVRDDDPIATLTAPMVPAQPVVVLSLEQVRALLAATSGKSFDERRDNAIMRLFMEPGGARLTELTALTIAQVDLELDMVTVLGKGRKERSYPFGAKTGQALDRYLRVRARHELAGLPLLWLGKRGPLGVSGVQQMLRRRAAQVGISRLYPHMFRHTSAHEWLANGGGESDAMQLFGWSSPAMLQRYARSTAVVRAQDASRRMGLSDRY